MYNSKHSLFAEISEALFKNLYDRSYGSLPPSILKSLIDKGFLCEEEEQYLFYTEEMMRFNAGVYNDTELGVVIVPTTDCNFGCPYCFEGEKNPHVMSEDIQDAVIDYISKNAHAEKIHLTWYGG